MAVWAQLFQAIVVTVISVLVGLDDIGTSQLSSAIAGTFLLVPSSALSPK